MGYLEDLQADIEDIKRWQKAIEKHLGIELVGTFRETEEMIKEYKKTGVEPDRYYYKVEDKI